MRKFTPRIGCILALAVFSTLARAWAASDVWVAEGGSDSASGTEADPFATITYALTQCDMGGTVHVKAGTYEITAEILVEQDAKIVGEDRETTTVTRKSGTCRVFHLNHESAVVSGLTISNGTGVNGAGAYIDKGTLSDCHVTKNLCGVVNGAGVYVTGSSSVVTNCLIDWNTSGGWGSASSGVTVGAGALLVDCDVMWNKQASNNGSDACGVAIYGGTIRGCRVMHNLTTGSFSYADYAGGVVVRGTGGTIERCLIAENYTHSGKMPGAGLTIFHSNNSQKATVTDSTIVANETDLSGGGVYVRQGNVYLTNCVIQANTAFAEPQNAEYNVKSGSVSFDHCVSPVTLPGTDNVVATLNFSDTVNYAPDYHPAAVYAGWKKASDLILNASFQLDKSCVMTNEFVSVTASATAGTGGGALSYRWDFGDGSGWTASSAVPTASHRYQTPDQYTVTLETSAAGVATPVTYTQTVRAAPLVAHVVDPATHAGITPVYPYLTEGTAATNIQDAVDAVADGSTVIVHPGSYETMGPVTIRKGLTLESSDGRDSTIIQSGLPASRPSDSFVNRYLRRAVLVDHPSAVVRGFTMKGGICQDDSKAPTTCGTTAQIGNSGGTICDCTVTDSKSGASYGGSLALYGAQSVVSNCLVSGNSANDYDSICGGIYMNAGLLTHSVITGNGSGHSKVHAGGLMQVGGLAQYMTITNNASSDTAGGVYLGGSSAILANSLVMGNSASYNGGGVYANAGNLLNCTITGNKTTGGLGGGVYAATSARIYGCLITGNTTSSSDTGAGKPEWYGGDANTYLYSCASVAFPDGCVDCTNGVIAFETGTYKPLVGMNCNNLMPTNVYSDLGLPDPETLTDYYGQRRFCGKKIDAGCAEYQQAEYEATVELSARVAVGQEAVFTVKDDVTVTVYYSWRADDGEWTEYSSEAKQYRVTFSTAGDHVVEVRTLKGAKTFGPYDCACFVSPSVAYVVEPDWAAQTGHVAVSPYESWETAATNVADAVAVSCNGTEVVVADGVYRLTSQIEVTSGIHLHSVNGAASTELRNVLVPVSKTLHRVLRVNHPDARIDGFTLSNGNYNYGSGDENYYGLGLQVGSDGGTVVNCVITNNGANSASWGDGFALLGARGVISNCVVSGNTGSGGVGICGIGGYVKAGLVTHCLFTNNVNYGRMDSSATPFSTQGAGLLVSGGRVTHCRFVDNRFGGSGADGQWFGGGAIFLNGSGLVDNCLIWDNTCQTARGGGVRADGGTLLNCTICENAAGTGGGLYASVSATVRNCIFQDNSASTDGTDVYGTPNATYSLAPSGLPDGEGNVHARALFRPGWRHRQRRGSPSIDAGSTVGYEEYLDGLDMHGYPRILGPAIDIGAQEWKDSFSFFIE